MPEAEGKDAGLISDEVFELIKKEHPDFSRECWISVDELNVYRKRYMEELIRQELEELQKLNEKFSQALQEGKKRTARLHGMNGSKESFGNRMADKVAAFGGSWKFVLIFIFAMITWMIFNLLLGPKSFDHYPFILLNLGLSALAALQAPIIMMSQNRQEEKDRGRAEHDYRVNVKAELEIKLLHDKIDYLMISQNKRMLDIQHMQAEYLEDILRQIKVSDNSVST